MFLFTAAGCGDDDDAGCVSDAECAVNFCVDGVCQLRPDASVDSGRADVGADVGSDVGAPDVGVDTGPMCVATESPVELTCNGVDDDCNGRIDDVDVGDDGFCDCLTIGVLGGPGANPSANFELWLEARGTTVTRLSGVAPLEAADLASFDILVVDNIPRALEAAEVQVLVNFVEAGGGLMTMTGYSASPARVNSITMTFGVEHIEGLISGPADQWEAHPIALGIASVTFAGGFALRTLDDTAATTIASIAGAPVGLALERGEGRVFVWGDEWIQFDSEWGGMPMIQALWSNIINWIGPRNSCQILLI